MKIILKRVKMKMAHKDNEKEEEEMEREEKIFPSLLFALLNIKPPPIR